jgi:hypothetical protein
MVHSPPIDVAIHKEKTLGDANVLDLNTLVCASF